MPTSFPEQKVTHPESTPSSYVNESPLIVKLGPIPPVSNFYNPQKAPKTDFSYISNAQVESHALRRKMILQKYPDVKKVLIADKPHSLILAIILVFVGLTGIYIIKDWPLTWYLVGCYVFGGTLCHTMHVLVHDFTHFAGHSNPLVNTAFAIICNIPSGIPSAISFGKFHADHHNFLGEEGRDPDLPTKWETRMFRQYTVFRWMFFFFLAVVYAVRPIFVFPKKILKAEIANAAVCLIVDALIWKYWGAKAVVFMVLSTLISMGPHPAAMHVLAEHYQFVKGQQTYNYFGIWNFFNLNLGYHLEHHDFPTCPWYNLPKVRAIAKEFYEPFPHHTSYLRLAIKFLTDHNFSLYNRTTRTAK